jgi:hypothetical protein
MVAQKYRVVLATDKDPEPDLAITMRSSAIPARLERR